MGISIGTIKSVLSRSESIDKEGKCKEYGKPLTMTKGKKDKVFCSDKVD